MNYFDKYTWEKILSLYPQTNEKSWDIKKYYQILSPHFPSFLHKYINLPILQRLKGIGLLCGTDWTPLYKNRFYYSRLDHSIGVALIIWNFTKDKTQTISGLLHDVSTPVFSHVSDFRKGDALSQTSTESINAHIIQSDKELSVLLRQDGININQIKDYHIYPIADNEIPHLSADRLEYMFPSGMVLEGSWNLDEVEKTYKDITILINESNTPELGFNTPEIAENYCRKFCMTGHVLQLNENKLTLQLLGQIMNQAVDENILSESDFMTLSEKEILDKLDEKLLITNKAVPFVPVSTQKPASSNEISLASLYLTFKTMTSIEHTQIRLSPLSHFSVNLDVKQRYIDPLVKTGPGQNAKRLSRLSPLASSLITDFLSYKDTPFGCVKLKTP